MKAISEALKSGDKKQRRLALLFYFGVAGVLLTAGIGGISVFRSKPHPAQPIDVKVSTHEPVASINEVNLKFGQKVYAVQVGVFAFDLIRDQESRNFKMGIAQLEVWAECETKVACEHISHSADVIKDSVTPIFTSVTKKDLLTQEGKKRLRDAIRYKLGDLIHGGEILNVYFTKLLVS